MANLFFNDSVAAAVVQVKPAQGFITSLHLINTSGADAYLQMFNNIPANITLGSTAPYWVIHLATGATYDCDFSANAPFFPPQVTKIVQEGGFLDAVGTVQEGISLAGTTTAGGNTGATISVSLTYK